MDGYHSIDQVAKRTTIYASDDYGSTNIAIYNNNNNQSTSNRNNNIRNDYNYNNEKEFEQNRNLELI